MGHACAHTWATWKQQWGMHARIYGHIWGQQWGMHARIHGPHGSSNGACMRAYMGHIWEHTWAIWEQQWGIHARIHGPHGSSNGACMRAYISHMGAVMGHACAYI